MKYIILFFLIFIFQINIYSQIPITKNDTINLSEVIISGNRFNSLQKNNSQKIDLISQKTISEVNAQNMGDLLSKAANVFVQKSQQGGSSPVIRGFEASRILLVVDGVKYNNAIFRTGHLQNIISVDANMLERVEVVNGPSSTLFGSDALGGTIQMFSKPVILSKNKKIFLKQNFILRGSSNNNEKTGHWGINIANNKLGYLGSINYSDFGDMRMGANFNELYPNFGKKDSVVSFINNTDIIIENKNKLIQKQSGYKQWDILQKFFFKISDKDNLSANVQLSNSSNIPRYDRLQDLGSNNSFNFAEWYYGPQKRNLYLLKYETSKENILWSKARITLSHQNIFESRQTRIFGRYDRFDSRRENVKVTGFIAEAQKIAGDHNFSYGFDMQLNDVVSLADRTNILTGLKQKLLTRYPDGKNKMNSFAIYLQHQFKAKNNKWIVNEGFRLQSNTLNANIKDNSFLNLPITQTLQKTKSITGNIGFNYFVNNEFYFTTNISSGFRAPNIDDAIKVFESSTALRRVILPNANLKPERTLSYDIGFSFKREKKLSIDGNIYFTRFSNAISLLAGQLNGADSIIFNSINSKIFLPSNINKANVFGLQSNVKISLHKNIILSTGVSYTIGNFIFDKLNYVPLFKKQNGGTYKIQNTLAFKKPLDHIPPVLFSLKIDYRKNKINTNINILHNGNKFLNAYNADGEDNQQYATPIGTLAFTTVNINFGYQLNNSLKIQMCIENLLDKNYRPFASGFSASGRNVFVSINGNF